MWLLYFCFNFLLACLICESYTTGGKGSNDFIYGNKDSTIPGYKSFMSTAYPEMALIGSKRNQVNSM